MKLSLIWQPVCILLLCGCGGISTPESQEAVKDSGAAAKLEDAMPDNGPLFQGTFSGTIHERIIHCFDDRGCQNWSDDDEAMNVTVGRNGSVMDSVGGQLVLGSEFRRQYNEFELQCVITGVREIHNVLLFEIDVTCVHEDGEREYVGSARLFLQAEGPDVLEYGYSLDMNVDDSEDRVIIVRAGALNRR